MQFVYIRHALDMLVERKIERAWVERTVLEPELITPDPLHPERRRAFRAVPDRDGRMLRVVYEPTDAGVRIITLFLDRGRSRNR